MPHFTGRRRAIRCTHLYPRFSATYRTVKDKISTTKDGYSLITSGDEGGMFNYLFYVDYNNIGTFEDPIISTVIKINPEVYDQRKEICNVIISAEETDKQTATRVLNVYDRSQDIIKYSSKDNLYALRSGLQRGTNGSTYDNGTGLRDGRGTGRTGREFNKIKWATINGGYLKELNRGNNIKAKNYLKREAIANGMTRQEANALQTVVKDSEGNVVLPSQRTDLNPKGKLFSRKDPIQGDINYAEEAQTAIDTLSKTKISEDQDAAIATLMRIARYTDLNQESVSVVAISFLLFGHEKTA